MKSLEELKAIKAKMQDKVVLRKSSGDIRIVVGM
ncbi:MAG: (2Fe-2S) ferredoxin domain-containing protein, partial [Ruminococcaceae bacterium]|nr:(2Fe-2S) ferredoxin domain-containing protein [Oscillospiraceae bacterium]